MNTTVAEKPNAFGKLGRSFSSLLGEGKDDLFERELILEQVEPSRLTPSPYQPRTDFNEESLRELSESISRNGIIQPIVCRPKGKNYEIIAGERRWRASKMAGLRLVPIIVREATDRDVMEHAIVENVQRRDLDPIEEAQGYRRLLGEFGYTQEDLANTIGKSRSHIANMLRLLSLPENVKAMVRGGKITIGHARALLGAENPAEIAQKIAEGELSVRQTEDIIRIMAGGQVEETVAFQQVVEAPQEEAYESEESERFSTTTQKDPDILALEQRLKQQFGAKVVIKTKNDRGEIRIKFKNLEHFDTILRKLELESGKIQQNLAA